MIVITSIASYISHAITGKDNAFFEQVSELILKVTTGLEVDYSEIFHEGDAK